MASFFVRRKSLIFKAVVGIPALWFLIVTLLAFKSKDPNEDFRANPHVQLRQQNDLKEPGPDPGVDQKFNQERDINWVKPAEVEDSLNRHGQERQIQDEVHHQVERQVNQAERVDVEEVKVDEDEERVRRQNIPEPQQGEITKTTTLNPNAPGELGRAIHIKKEQLSPGERKKFDDGWQNNAFNEYASNMMSLHRSLPDVRDAECKDIKYADTQDLPDTSVIICFHNEAWSVLLRTVHSVLDRSPKRLIKEIILVDDFSDMEHLGPPLRKYIAPLGVVRVVRTKKREGLIRARLLGASVATGTVLTYLDSHCECAKGWLEPLLDEIKKDKRNVVCPVIDVIEDDSFKFQYSSARSTSVGGFDWNLQFNWHPIPDHERKRRGNDFAPIRSPTMAGGLFSISREYFEELGAYDPGMDIWGGENLELSFRVWMCGGTLEIIPCSHVGHIFRKRSPYSWKNGENVVKKNSVRLAEVWMDEYKQYYYERFNFDLGQYGDVSARKELRKNLKCKSFDWYIKNVFPDLFVPGDAAASGEIRSKVMPMCLDSSADAQSFNKPVKMWQCHQQGGNQYWMLSKAGEIRRDEGCMDYTGSDSVNMFACHSQKGNQEWLYGPDSTLKHANTNRCMELSEDGQHVSMQQCTGIDRQIWVWKRKT